jgi:FimV-like protein
VRALAGIAATCLLAGCAGGVPRYVQRPWIEVRTDNFHLISSAEEARTIEVARRLEEFRSVAGLLTAAKHLDPALPTRVFVFGDEEDWRRVRPAADVPGFFLSDMEANYIALHLSDGALEEFGELVPDAVVNQPFETVLHEYVHFLIRNQASRIHYPTWYEEGFADAISTARVEERGVVVGSIPYLRAAWLVEARWLPLEHVVTARGYAEMTARERAMFYAQSWLLVHRLTWGHVAGFEPRNEQMEAYIVRVARGDPPATAFPETFGVGFDEMQEELRRYADQGPPLVLARHGVPDFEFAPRVQPLPRGAHLLHLCELQLARGADGAADAEALARLALADAPDDPRALVLLALAQVMQDERADPGLAERAVALAPDDPAVLRSAGRLALLELQHETHFPDERARIAEQARDLFARAVDLDPGVPAAFAGLGYAFLALGDPGAADRALREAFQRARWDLSLALALGELHAEFGEPEGARVLLREVAGSAHDDAMRKRAQELLDQLDAGEK